jgi:hypothetical protein
MIKILVDEGYAYDYLAILAVKTRKFRTEASIAAFDQCYDYVSEQVGQELHASIMKSDEYFHLFYTNQETFDAVEQARYGQISAKEVDDLNMKRYKAKVALQNKFFPKQKISEHKS